MSPLVQHVLFNPSLLKVSYKIVDEFWHSDLASDPDNQNKAKVLCSGMVIAVRATGAEKHLEGPVWLLHIGSEAFEVRVGATDELDCNRYSE